MKKYLLCLGLILGAVFWHFMKDQPAKSPKKTVCLNMIVKDEKDVIERCLTSVLPIIDYWVIVDTGSTDGTQEVIKKFMKEKSVPGELHERPWVNFAHNRNEALALAKTKADYVFVIDADEYLVYDPDFYLPPLDKDYYYVTLRSGGTKWPKLELMKTSHDWKYVGVLHEVICPTHTQTHATLEKVYNTYTTDGARSKDPKKFEKDAAILEAALKEEPDNSRHVFYLAQSYACAGIEEKACETYEKRAQMSQGYDQEVFWSLLQVGILKEKLKRSPDEVIAAYKNAVAANRLRAEPYYHLASYYRSLNDFESAYKAASIGLTLPMSNDLLFVQEWMYDYGLLLEYSISAYWLGKYQECQAASLALLNKELPQHVRECVQRNLGFANEKLLETETSLRPIFTAN